jgi:hypothetical protein
MQPADAAELKWQNGGPFKSFIGGPDDQANVAARHLRLGIVG